MVPQYAIEIIDLKKKFGSTWVSRGITLRIPARQMTVIIGQSGEGKSVLLKQMIGLIAPTSGSIMIEGVDITRCTERELEVQRKRCGYVFQFAALLDSLTIGENVGIALLEKGMSREAVMPIVAEKLALVNLSPDILHTFPSELSGGMRKRVGFARTLVTNPALILYDEPTTGLDPITTRVIHKLMATTQKRLQATSVVISHDVEIFNYADNVALLYEGAIVYFGSAKTIWQSDNPYVHQFIHGMVEGPIQAEQSNV